jgi:hypothetical protein
MSGMIEIKKTYLITSKGIFDPKDVIAIYQTINNVWYKNVYCNDTGGGETTTIVKMSKNEINKCKYS